MFKRTYVIISILALQACTLATTNYIRNETSVGLVVSVKQERKDLGLEKDDRESIAVAANHICSIITDPFWQSYLFIKNPTSGQSTNIGILESDNYIYTVSIYNNEQVVTVREVDGSTERQVGKQYQSKCVSINGSAE
ncbi:hypothetical protein ACJJIL_12600 [Microbulbifer sp. EKSA005]|uniref:hypothetical protein n=1 Tax=Microbulbifer sp. EKSA005 TaxID=3243364 RepID=UPI0040435EBB